MMTVETEKPKRKQKRGAWRRWQIAGLVTALLLTLIGGSALGFTLLHTALPNPTATPYITPSPTPLVLADQCALTGNTYQIRADGELARERLVDSPDKNWRVRYNAQGITLYEQATNQVVEKLADTLPPASVGANADWSQDSRYVAYSTETELFIYDTQTKTRHTIPATFKYQDTWSPFSDWYTFTDETHIWLTNPDGSQARVIAPINTGNGYYRVIGWSPAGTHLILDYYAAANKHIVTLVPLDASQPTHIENIELSDNLIQWSPDGKRFTYMAYTSPTSTYKEFVLAALDGRPARTYQLPLMYDYYDGQNVQWSPDGRFVAVFYNVGRSSADMLVVLYDGLHDPLALAETGENLFYQVELDEMTRPLTSPEAWAWSDDSRFFRYWAKLADGRHALYEYDTEQQNNRLIFEGNLSKLIYMPFADAIAIQNGTTYQQNLLRLDKDMSLTPLLDIPLANALPLSWSPEGRAAVAVAGTRDVNPTLDVVHTVTGQHTSLLVGDEYSPGWAAWSPKGTYVAVTYATTVQLANGEGVRRVGVHWANAATGEMHTLEDDFLSVYNLLWSPDERYMAYLAWRETSGTTLEVADMLTGEHWQVVEDATRARDLKWDETLGAFTLWVPRQGTLLWEHRMIAPDGTVIMPDVNTATDMSNAKIFWSPDQTYALVKGGLKLPIDDRWNRWFETMEWFDQAGNHRTINKRLVGLGNPVFTPDGEYFMVTEQSYDTRELLLRIIDANGVEVWRTPLPKMGYFEWIPCLKD